ncbi:hypothetical protein C3460_17630 [Serratia marcescens]|nr:hypothetical protein C3462_18670 [Serratia marcescens]POX14250.1 hypothetical protein C3460_17630 [Serratia marcescens]
MLIGCWNIALRLVNKRFSSGIRIVFEQLTDNVLIYIIFLSLKLLKTVWLTIGYKSGRDITVIGFAFLNATLE